VKPETENDAARESCSANISRSKIPLRRRLQRKPKKDLLKMFDTLKRDAMLCALTAAMLAVATPSFAQPTEAQKEAFKSACRSDFMAHCSSVQPGGEAALQCLAKNMSSLSAGCASAVKAIEASAEPKSEPAKSESAPAAAAPAEPKTETAKPAAEPKGESKPAATTAAKKPTDAQVAAIRSACRGDYPKVCAGVPTGGAPALECLEKNKARVSAGCGKALAAVGGGAAAPAAGGAAPAAGGAAPAAAPVVIVLRPMRPREELFVMRSACGGDIRTLCAGVAPGGGRIMQCVANRAADLSPACKDVLVPFMAR
jgi:Cysteine rich repeat